MRVQPFDEDALSERDRALLHRIDDRSARMVVVGLGFVGTPVACRFAEAGFRVTGLDVVQEKVDLINQGVSPIEGDEPGLPELLASVVEEGRLDATTEPACIAEADVVLVAVETPVEPETHQPRYDALRGALASMAPHLRPGSMVIIESTLAPGTMRDLVVPALSSDLHLVHCPERVMPGRLLANLANMSRAVGGMTREATLLAMALYRHMVDADLDATDALTAEIVKTAENAYRDVQIAFANELAMICAAQGAEFWPVRELVNKSPGRNVLLAGAGVGGHCIPKDPWLLISSVGGPVEPEPNSAPSPEEPEASEIKDAREAPDPLRSAARNVPSPFVPRLIPAARAVNDSMPGHMARLLLQALSDQGIAPKDARVALLGYSYLEDSEDCRNSPSAALVEVLKALGIEHVIHDPWVEEYKGDLIERVQGCHALLFMVAHDAYRALDPSDLATWLSHPVIVDGRAVIDPDEAKEAGLRRYAIGSPSPDG
jgi:UDP-N-acetyl-D-mannosaminuronic acid dehydrogenase